LWWRHQRTRSYDFAWPDVLVLVRADDRALEQEVVKGALERVELGALKGNQGDQNCDLPATVDLHQYQAVRSLARRFTRYPEWRVWRSFGSADSSGTDGH
jgi:hypothetical protein